MTVATPPRPILPARRRPWGIAIVAAVLLAAVAFLAIGGIGHAAVIAGLGLSAYAVACFVLAARGGDAGLATSARRAVGASLAAAGIGSMALVISLLTHDFSVLYVAKNNATTTPPFISAISLWAALEGSILFWTLLATGWAALVLRRFRDRARALMPWVG